MEHNNHYGVVTGPSGFEYCRECTLTAKGKKYRVYDEGRNPLSFSSPQYRDYDAAKEALLAYDRLWGRGSIQVIE